MTKRMYHLIVYLLLCVSCSSCSSTHSKSDLIISKNKEILQKSYKIALLPFKNKYIRPRSSVGEFDVPVNAGEIVAQYVEKELLRTEKFKIIDREHLSKILEEQKVSLSGITENVADVGKLLNADGIIVGEVIELNTLKQAVNLNGTCVFIMKLIDVKSGEVIFTFNAEEKVPFGSYLDALSNAVVKFRQEIESKL